MEDENSAKAKIKSGFKQITPQLEKLDRPISTGVILRENKQDLPENIADRSRHSITCEAIDCYSKADTEVHLKVGTKGLIPLFLCTSCKSKLRLGGTTESEILEQGNLVKEREDDA